jgi:hypothetical protein
MLTTLPRQRLSANRHTTTYLVLRYGVTISVRDSYLEVTLKSVRVSADIRTIVSVLKDPWEIVLTDQCI